MKKSIIISINPEHVENIINGTKKYEYRTRAAKQDINKILIYETVPVKKIVAEAKIEEVLILPKEELWLKTKYESGITKEFYDKYFDGREVACAYKLGKITVYRKPKELIDFGLNYAPQSYAYVMNV